MEGTPHLAERLLVHGIFTPARQVITDGFENLGSLLDEHLQQVIIDCLFTLRRRQKAWRNIPCRGIDGSNRCCQYVRHGHDRLVVSRLNHRVGQRDFGHIECRHLRFAPIDFVADLVIGRLPLGIAQRLDSLSANCLRGLCLGQLGILSRPVERFNLNDIGDVQLFVVDQIDIGLRVEPGLRRV